VHDIYFLLPVGVGLDISILLEYCVVINIIFWGASNLQPL
jgi:hypothetical protein